MDVLFWLLVLAVIEGGIIAGVSFDVAFVKLPTRKRVGQVAYAQFARGNDLGNGKLVYPILGIVAILLIAAATTIALVQPTPLAVRLPICIAAAMTMAHSLCTAKAAPIMLSLAKTPDDPNLLQQKLDRFTFWHGIRTVFQIAAFVALLTALVSASR